MKLNIYTVTFLLVALVGGVHAAEKNLVPNGNFEQGNVTFVSEYSYSPASNTDASQYTVSSSPYPWNSFFVPASDHTSGSGLMFIGNGSPTNGAIVWRSVSITVAPNTDYFFEAFVMDVCCRQTTSNNSPATLEFFASGATLGVASTNSVNAGSWQGLGKTWNSGSATSVVLSLVNRNTELNGNDFAIDDIYLGTQSSMVPESGTFALMGLGAGLIALRRRYKNLSWSN